MATTKEFKEQLKKESETIGFKEVLFAIGAIIFGGVPLIFMFIVCCILFEPLRPLGWMMMTFFLAHARFPFFIWLLSIFLVWLFNPEPKFSELSESQKRDLKYTWRKQREEEKANKGSTSYEPPIDVSSSSPNWDEERQKSDEGWQGYRYWGDYGPGP
jgi:amino acid permease